GRGRFTANPRRRRVGRGPWCDRLRCPRPALPPAGRPVTTDDKTICAAIPRRGDPTSLDLLDLLDGSEAVSQDVCHDVATLLRPATASREDAPGRRCRHRLRELS